MGRRIIRAVNLAGDAMRLISIGLAIILVFCLPIPGRSDGPTALQLQKTLAAGAVAPPNTAQGSLLEPNADISNTTSIPAGATTARSTATREAERPSVLDFGVKGGGFVASLMQPQQTGDQTAWAPNNAAVSAGKLITSPYLPMGTTITALGPLSAMTPTFSTNAATTPLGPQSLGTALTFNAMFAVPMGASVTGNGILANTTVTSVAVSQTGTTVYISNPVAAIIAAGTAVTFGYSIVPLTISSGWTQSVAAGTSFGITQNDDGAAFARAFSAASMQNGGAGTIFIPAGAYYASNTPSIDNGVAVEAAANVVLLPGTTPIGDLHGFGSGYAGHTIATDAQSIEATTLNLNQSLFQQTVPTAQIQGEMISQHNVGCINDGGPWGCGMVGEELQQSMGANITEGVMWGYHVTDSTSRGQRIGWAGAELELNNQSGNDEPQPGTVDVSEALHLDNIGNTPTTVGVYFGGNTASNAYWHDAIDCPDASISDYCIRVADGVNADTLAGIDIAGNLSGQSLSIGPALNAAAGAPGAAIDGHGNAGVLSLNTQTITTQTSSVQSVAVLDGGIFDAAPALLVQPPPAGGISATVAATSYALRSIVAWQPVNNPTGTKPGDVYTVVGGTCSIQPTIGYDGTSWSVANPGSCSNPPWGTASTPAASTGGNAAPQPQFQLGYQVTAIGVVNPGAGYNRAVPPLVYSIRANNDLGSYHVKTRLALANAVPAPLTMTNSLLVENGPFQASGSVVSSQTGSYTFAPGDCGTTVRALSGNPATYTIPAGLPVGCIITVLQIGQGQVSFAAAPNETIEAVGGASRSTAQFARVALEVDTAATVHVSGQIQ